MAAQIHLQLARQIVETLKSICEHDINYIDINGKICASTDPQRVDGYHEGGLLAARQGEIITIQEDDPRRELRRGINMPIRHNGEIVAVIGITGPPEEVLRYADLAQRITLLLLREHEMDLRDHNNRTQVNHLLRALLQNESVHPNFLREVLTKNGLRDENALFRTVIFRLSKMDRTPRFATLEGRMAQLLEGLERKLFTFFYPSTFVVVAEAEELDRYLPRMKDQMGLLEGAVSVGVGTRRRLARQHLSYQAAELALNTLAPGELWAAFDDLDLEILLASASPAAGDAFCGRALRGLEEKDKLLLSVYFDCDGRLQEAADRLYLHKNSLQYHLGRIRDKTGYDPRRFREGAVLYAALMLDRLRQKTGA